MNLQPSTEQIIGRKEFLNTTQGLVNKVGGITLGAGFTGDEAGYLKAGSGVAVGADGLAVPFTIDGTTGATNGTLYVTADDVKATAGNVVGAHEVAFLKESVVTATETGRVPVTQAFIDASNGRFHLR